MALIIAARFETFESAERAAASLFGKGIHEDAVHIFFVNLDGAHEYGAQGGESMPVDRVDRGSRGSLYGAIAGAAVVGLAGAVIGAVITLNVTDSLIPIVGGAAAGAYIGSLAGAVWLLGQRTKAASRGTSRGAEEKRLPGVLLAVHADADSEERISGLLRSAGGTDVERARGRWENGRWVDFAPAADLPAGP